MKVFKNKFYHLTNRGTGYQLVFKSAEDYYHFLRLVKTHLLPYSAIMTWCLLPNQFHFLLKVNESGAELFQSGALLLSRFSNGVRLMQSQYAQYYNKKYNRNGSLFKAKAIAKPCDDDQYEYGVCAFENIHSMPLYIGIVKSLKLWPFSSYNDYFQNRNGNLCTKDLVNELFTLKSSYPFLL